VADERDAAIQAIRDQYDTERLGERAEELGDPNEGYWMNFED
jgi:hypothetical protein